MKTIYYILAILTIGTYGTDYDILLKERYELGADSIIYLDSNDQAYAKHTFIRSNDKVIELFSNNIQKNDTMAIYYLNEVGKLDYSYHITYLKTYYDNSGRPIRVCCSEDTSFFDSCSCGEVFMEYDSLLRRIISNVLINSTTNIYYNEFNDINCLVDSSSDGISIDSIYYDYENGIVCFKEFDSSSINESYFYFSNRMVIKVVNFKNGEKTSTLVFFYPDSRIAAIKRPVISNTNQFNFSYLLNGRRIINKSSFRPNAVIIKDGKYVLLKLR